MKRTHASVIGASLLLAAVLAPSSVEARTPGSARPSGGIGHPEYNAKSAHLRNLPSLARGNKAQQIFVQLGGRPVASYQAANLAINGTKLSEGRKQSIRGQIGQQQRGVRVRISATGAKVQSTFTDVLNGFRVLATPSQARAIADIPGVTKLYAIPRVQREDLTSAQYVNAIKAWTDNGVTGAGVTIAIIDSGINYYHANYGGAGNPGWQNDNPTIIEPGTFPTAKVVGGYDLAGDAYDPGTGGAAEIPHPDPDPLDCKGDPNADDHGDHVAGIAAGEGVKANGQTYTGPYTANAINNTNFEIGPGIAPQAKLYALKVFGCEGPTDLVQDAIERATRAGVDVINMSLGVDFGNPGSIDSIAVNAAAEAGIVVVMSSGNAGQSAYITGSPGAAQRGISVGAVDAGAFIPGGVVVDVPGSKNDVGGYNMYGSKVPVTGTLHVLKSGNQITDGCAASNWTTLKRGDVAVIVRGNCDFSFKRGEAQSHGAVGVVLINNVPDTVVNPVEDPDHHIPMISVNPSHTSALVAANGQKATLHAGNVANEFFGSMADFSSAGPERNTNIIKPDVSAPGVLVNSTDGNSVNKGKLLSGTSMASPQVAGAAALILQANPSWSPQHVKGAIVGTASTSKVDPYVVRWSGSGILDAKKAINTSSWAESADEQGSSSITFGYQPITLRAGGSTALSVSRGIRLSNSSSHAITYRLSNDANGGMMGASLSFPSSVTVPAKSSRTIYATITMSNAAAAALPSMAPGDVPVVATSAEGSLYTPLVDIAGAIVATPTANGTGMYPIRVPWILVPRGTSDVRAYRPTTFTGGATRTANVHVKNKGVHQGNVDVFAWGLSDQAEGQGEIDLRAGGVQSLPTEVCTGTPDPNDRCLIFAINTWNRWNSGAENEYDVNIDLNNDGKAEFALVGIDYAAVFGPGAIDGVPISLVLDKRNGSNRIVDVWFATAAPNSSTILLPVLASELGRTGSSPTFRYWAQSFLVYDDSGGPTNPVLSTDLMLSGNSGSGGTQLEAYFNAFNNALSNGDFLSLQPGANGDIPISIRKAAYKPAANSQKGWMFVNLEGRDGAQQVELIPVKGVQ
jgi:subtilisin family serine protease